MKERLNLLWNKIKERSRNTAKEVWYFLSSTFFLKNFGGMVATIVFFLILIFWWLKCYTNHGESLQVPDYTGFKLEQAVKKAKGRNLKVVVIDSIWRQGMEPNVVLEQFPEPFARIKEGRTIYIKTTKFEADEVELPTLTGIYDFNQYQNSLKRLQIDAVIRERIFDNKLEPNTILHFYYGDEKVTETMVREGYKVPQNSVLEFVITTRGGFTVEALDLVCQTYSAAEFRINSASLGFGEIVEDPNVTDRATAYIYRQDPPFTPGQRLQPGTRIKLYLSQELPTGCQ